MGLRDADERWDTVGQAIGLFLRGHTLRTAAPTALIVGTVLCAVNQGATLAEGAATIGTWVRMVINYLVRSWWLASATSVRGAVSGVRADVLIHQHNDGASRTLPWSRRM